MAPAPAPARIAAKAPPPPPTVVRPPVRPAPPPTPVGPAGPQLVPKPAELRGPRIVRIEAPEPVQTPRPRAPGPRGPGFDRGGAFTPSPPVGSPTTPGGRRPKARTAADEENERRKAQARNPRRHGAADLVMERMREWRDQDLIERKERLASATGHVKDRRVHERRRDGGAAPSRPAAKRDEIEVVCPLSVKDFCATVGVAFPTLLPKLIAQTGRPMTLNQMMDYEVVEMMGVELGLSLIIARAKTAMEKLRDEFEVRERENPKPRPPVVTVLGHVDHGKTSLLDRIRQTNVVATEAGGITQHIRAYRVDRNEWHVTFIDTPGHEAFTAMRARGANLTDVVVLVVAANDGVMPQTIEAINHAKAAKVPIVVALNKIDLPNLDQNRVLGQLAEQGLIPADWGGETDIIRTSALTGAGIDELLAHLSTLTELLDLKADPSVPAQASVIEANMRAGQGSVALVLVREGTLKLGDVFACGPASGKIRSITDDAGNRLKSAIPGTPVIVTGLDELPSAGDVLYVVSDLSTAKEVAGEIQQKRREESLRAIKPRGLEELLAAAGQGELPTLNIILRADVQGSVDALKAKFAEFAAEETKLNVLHAGVGAVTEADVRLAQASGCLIVAYNVVAEDRARQLADSVGVEIRQYRIIYDVLNDLEKALRGMLEPETRVETRGKVEVRQVFNVSRVGTIAGCHVLDGTIARSHRVRLVRDGRIILEDGELDSLKRFKDDAREVRAGLECGVKISGFDDVKPGDIIETYEVVDVERD
ncbi:MAG: translation initiation factor IF-2 [Phycisphaerales bacterium]|nr:translation initiation factor IF-2 [Phycisphaerales bacterium]